MASSTSSAPLPRLIRYSRKYRTQVWLAVICSILNKLFDLAPPLLIGVAVDIVVNQNESWLAGWGLATVTQQLIVLSILTFIVWGLESIFEYAYARLWRNLAQTIQHILRLDAYTHLQDLELSIRSTPPYGKLYFYEHILQVPIYVTYDPYETSIEVRCLQEGKYVLQQADEKQRWWIPELELFLGIWQGERLGHNINWLRWWDREDNLLLWSSEQAQQERQRAEQEHQRAEQEHQRAEQEHQRAEILAAKLR
ncbi:MAG: hypothetical protein F6K09_27190, partial [Merismopedia sp. SIO2A8]|nr:hypothetical protein [Merismopedia sp. SIO2A8]